MEAVIWFVVMALCTIVNFAWSAKIGHRNGIKSLYYGALVTGAFTTILAIYWAMQITW